MTSTAVLTDEVLRRHYDAATIARGQHYAGTGRVTLLDTTATGVLVGVVRGSEPGPYIARVEWTELPGRIVIGDSCTCPMVGRCKHCVAVIVAGRGAYLSARTGAETDWRRALGPLINAADAVPEKAQPLALQFEQIAPPGWNHRPSIAIRPLIRGVKGRWIKTGAKWADLLSPYAPPGRTPNPQQREILAGLAAVLRSELRYSDHIRLGDLGPSLWLALDRAVEAGVELLGPGPVELVATPVELGVDAVRSGGDIHISPVIDTGDEPIAIEPDRHVLLGHPAHGLVELHDDGGMRLFRFASPALSELASFVEHGPTVIPAAHVAVFERTSLRKLSRVVTLSSHDDSVAVPVTVEPRLRLHVQFDTARTANLSWLIVYGDGAVRLDGVGEDRDLAAEQRLVDGLVPRLPTLVLDSHGKLAPLVVHGTAVIELVDDALPKVAALGIKVTTENLPQLEQSHETPVVRVAVDDDADSHDWFDLTLTVTIGDAHVPFGMLFTALVRNDELLLLPSGTWFSLARPEFDQLRRLITEARALSDADADPSRVSVNRFQAGWFGELVELGVVETQSQRWNDTMAMLRNLESPSPTPAPSGLNAVLRPYQQDGFNWLVYLHDHGLGGVLADDMGLGKTVQTLALFAHVHEHRPAARFLVVAPTSVVSNWALEAQRFTPGLGVATMVSTRRRRGGVDVAEAVGDATIVVTSYTLFRLEIEQYESIDWDVLVLDEAQVVKNRQSKAYGAARVLQATTKLAITGTPMENSLMDLWSLLSITAPGLYPDPKVFTEVFRAPIEAGDSDRLAALRRRIAPLMRRRTKEEVLTDLPPKTEQTIEVDLWPAHARIYQTHLQRERQKILGLMTDFDKNRFTIFRSLTLLRQLALDPSLVDPVEYGEVGSAKIDQLVSHLHELIDEGHRALVFSQFTGYLALVRGRLDAEGISYSYLDGRTTNRAAVVSGFKQGDDPVFLISLKAGGVGLNLTEADYCFVLDPWWNPAVENQAVDRAHRIGQERPVIVYRYVAKDTIEEKVMALKADKQRMFDAVVDADGALSGAITADDIRGLFS